MRATHVHPNGHRFVSQSQRRFVLVRLDHLGVPRSVKRSDSLDKLRKVAHFNDLVFDNRNGGIASGHWVEA